MRAAVLIAFGALLATGDIQATIINVPDDQPTIQAGINVATDGDTVLVADGTYYENIDFKGKAITVASHFMIDPDTSHIDSTVIDGSQHTHPDSGSVVYFITGEDSNCVLSGFTIQGGSGTFHIILDVQGYSGGGIFCVNASPTIQDNIIRNNGQQQGGWGFGGGIYCENSTSTIENNIIKDNSQLYGGFVGGIGCFNVDIRISHNQIRNNYADNPGGGIICIYSSAFISNNVIVGNVSEGECGGISVWASDPIIHTVMIASNLIANNSGGGILCNEQSRISIVNNTIVNNGHDGIDTDDEASVIMLNTICWNNEDGEVDSSDGSINYSNIQGGCPGEGNIDADPSFVDAANGDYHLSDGSPCIGAATDSIQINGTWYYAPPYDMDGNPRPDPPGSQPDMGAYESELGVPLMALTGTLSHGLLILQWTPCTGAAAYWVYGAGNEAYFQPGFVPPYEYRLTVLLPWITMWSSSDGIGDPENNWTYLVVAMDDTDQELMRSNYCGEQDYEGDIP